MVAIPVSEHVQRPARVTGSCGSQPELTGRGENGKGHQRVRKIVFGRGELRETFEQRPAL